MKIISNMIEAHIFRETKDGIEFLLLKRSEKEIYPGLWQMVTGQVEENETAYHAALREILEETGLRPERLWVVPNVNTFYSHENNTISLLPVFAAKVSGHEEIKICDEHTESCWYNPEKAKSKLAWEGQRHSVDLISRYHSKDRIFWDYIEINLS
jgi:dihydroneopterin triphosphate diphosphatase